jgi:hypothetical protein
MLPEKLYAMPFAKVYPYYVIKVEKKGRTKAELDQIISWLTGYSQLQLEAALANQVSFTDFFGQAPAMNTARSLITGIVCGIRVEDIADPMMREIRYMDKIVDELAKGKSLEKIMRKEEV